MSTTAPAKTKAMPNNTPQRRSPAIIPCDEDEVEPTQQDHELVMPCPMPRRYNLWKQAVHIIKSEALKREMYMPRGMFVGAITNPDTGKQLEYRDLV
eukprot:7793163-Ditylum_brightwellii.AAC.1